MGSRWSRQSPTLTKQLLRIYDRVLTPFRGAGFSAADAPQLALHRVTVQRGAWRWPIAVWDSAPHLAGQDDVETVVFSHGLMCSAVGMWVDLISWLVDAYRGQRVRVLAIDLPGHGESAKPSPDEFDYRMWSMAEVCAAALDDPSIGFGGGAIHVTQSLGYILSAHDMLTGRRRFTRWISYGTSPEQLAMVLTKPLTSSVSALGQRTLVEFAIACAPSWLVSYADFFDVFVRWVAAGAPWSAVDGLLSAANDPAATRAWFAILHDGLGEYMSMGRRLYSLPASSGSPRLRATFVAGADDPVTPVAGVRKHVELLQRSAAVAADLVVVAGSHFGIGDSPMRRALFDAIAAELTAPPQSRSSMAPTSAR